MKTILLSPVYQTILTHFIPGDGPLPGGFDTSPTYVPAVYPTSLPSTLHPPTMLQLKDSLIASHNSLLATAANTLLNKAAASQLLQTATTPPLSLPQPFKLDLKQALEALAHQVLISGILLTSIYILERS